MQDRQDGSSGGVRTCSRPLLRDFGLGDFCVEEHYGRPIRLAAPSMLEFFRILFDLSSFCTFRFGVEGSSRGYQGLTRNRDKGRVYKFRGELDTSKKAESVVNAWLEVESNKAQLERRESLGSCLGSESEVRGVGYKVVAGVDTGGPRRAESCFWNTQGLRL